mgnify:CR=1 FL=1
MKLQDIVYTLLIIVVFFALYYSNIFVLQINNVKKDWPKHRCNPMFMPFASYFGHDPIQNFTFCIQGMQSNYMNFVLQPLNYIGSMITNILGNVISDVEFIQTKIEDMTGNMVGVVSQILGIFINIIIEFQKILIKMKDTFSKIIGVVATSVYVIEGSMMTGKSIIDGPIGKTMRTVCFHPDTPIETQRGVIPIKKIRLGDKVQGCSEVTSIYRFTNPKDSMNKLYKIWSMKLHNLIHVTAQHRIFYKGKWICMKDHPYTLPSLKQPDEVYCLTTTNHRIFVGEHMFWDWEDDELN